MFTPEFISDNKGEVVLIANHSLESDEAIELSIAYNKARIAYGLKHIPSHLRVFRLFYDIRGQSISDHTITKVTEALNETCDLVFKRQ